MFIDSHTHIDIILKKEPKLTVPGIINTLQEAGIKHIVQVSVDTASFQWSYDLALKYREQGVRFTLGIHPSSTAWDKELTFLDEFLLKVIPVHRSLLLGIGECGLDYYRMRQEKSMQINSFKHQLYLAKKHKLPVIVHNRDATADTLSILKEYSPVKGIMHCFPGNRKEAKQFLDLGFYISYAGNVTYKKAYNLHESAAYIPLDRLLAETDAPYLTPEPLRGKTNNPQYVTHTYRFLAELRQEPLERLQAAVWENFRQLLPEQTD